MASILKVDQIQKSDGSSPTSSDLGFNVSGNVIRTGVLFDDTHLGVTNVGNWINACTFTIPNCTAGNNLRIVLSNNPLIEHASYHYYRVLYNNQEVAVAGTQTSSNGGWRGVNACLMGQFPITSSGDVVLTFQLYNTTTTVYNNYNSHQGASSTDGSSYIRTNLSWDEIAQ